MFTSAQMILDVYGRPIFVLPENLPQEGCHIKVGDTALDFHVGATRIGHIDGMETALLALVATQKTVGIIVYPENSKNPCPSALTHIATVEVL